MEYWMFGEHAAATAAEKKPQAISPCCVTKRGSKKPFKNLFYDWSCHFCSGKSPVAATSLKGIGVLRSAKAFWQF